MISICEPHVSNIFFMEIKSYDRCICISDFRVIILVGSVLSYAQTRIRKLCWVVVHCVVIIVVRSYNSMSMFCDGRRCPRNTWSYVTPTAIAVSITIIPPPNIHTWKTHLNTLYWWFQFTSIWSWMTWFVVCVSITSISRRTSLLTQKRAANNVLQACVVVSPMQFNAMLAPKHMKVTCKGCKDFREYHYRTTGRLKIS